MSTLAALITAAIIKVAATDPALDREGEPTAEESRDSFTAMLLHELGLGPMPPAAHAAVVDPKADEPAKKAPKKRAAKKTTEAVVAEAAVVVLEQVKEKTPEVEALAEQLGQLALEEQPKPKKARKTKTESAPASSESESEKPKEKKKPGPKPKVVEPPHPGIGAGVPAPAVVVPVLAEAAPKKKPGPKPKAKPEGPVNVDKLTPTHKKHLKAIAEELKCAIDDKAFLAYANAMSAEEWGAKSLDDHIRAFAVTADQTEFLEVEFNGKDYLIDPKTRFVYAATTGTVRDRVGVVGEKEFKDVELDE